MHRPLGIAVVFVAAGAVLVLEILAVRLAAPYVGLTLETYSAAIGIALTGIAAGAGIGGAVADRVDPRRTLGPTLIAGGALLLAVGPLFDWLGPQVGSGPKGALVLVGAATLPAIVVLSMAHPGVVKLLLARLDRTGSTVGALSAVGTAGALAGTFLTGFVLLGSYSTKAISVATGLIVIVLGAAVAVTLMRSIRAMTMAVVPVPLLALALFSDRPCDDETAYYCARVVVSSSGPSPIQTLVLDDLSHAAVDVRNPTRLFFPYVRQFADVADAIAPKARPLRALHIGGGGFSFSRYLAATRPGTRSVVLELDPGVVRIAEDRLGLRTAPALRARTGDARVSIRQEPDGAYHLVAGDAFASRSVPWHLTTGEFLREVRRVMRPDGVYVLNLIDGQGLRFLRAEIATLRTVFAHVALLAPADQLTAGGRGNYVVAASPRALPLESLRRRGTTQGYEVLGDEDVAEFAGAGPVLTDDYAPVDQLLSQRAATAVSPR